MSVSAVQPVPPSDSPQDSIAPITSVGEFQGKKVFHWSFYVQAVGALGGLIMAVAGLVLAMPAFIAPGLLFLTSNAIGAYYVHTFSVYSQLDTYVNELQEKLTEARADLIQQKALNTQLNDLVKKTQAEMIGLKEAGKKSLAEWEAREKRLKENVDSLEKATSQVEKERKQAVDDFDRRFNELHAEYVVLSAHKKAVDAQIATLKGEVSSLKDTNNSLAKELEEFKVNYDKYDKENEELKTLNENLKVQVLELTKQIKTIPVMNTKPLEKELDETEKAADKAVVKADELIKQMEELLKT